MAKKCEGKLLDTRAGVALEMATGPWSKQGMEDK